MSCRCSEEAGWATAAVFPPVRGPPLPLTGLVRNLILVEANLTLCVCLLQLIDRVFYSSLACSHRKEGILPECRGDPKGSPESFPCPGFALCCDCQFGFRGCLEFLLAILRKSVQIQRLFMHRCIFVTAFTSEKSAREFFASTFSIHIKAVD